MGKIITLPKTLRKNKDVIDEESAYIKTIFHDKLISLPSEFEFYLKKFKRVYKIEKSNSEFPEEICFFAEEAMEYKCDNPYFNEWCDKNL